MVRFVVVTQNYVQNTVIIIKYIKRTQIKHTNIYKIRFYNYRPLFPCFDENKEKLRRQIMPTLE